MASKCPIEDFVKSLKNQDEDSVNMFDTMG
jgi:hypothetical protein